MTDSTQATEPTTETERAARKVRVGVVVSNSMDKTAVVAVRVTEVLERAK
jgi:ribosomal protein S17